MVQRKVTNNLGIQANHVKSEKLLVNHLKPSSSQHQDGKNNRGGTDLKRKMKKSRSIKLMDIESLQSPNLRRQVPQPGKPPPLDVPTTAASPQKQFSGGKSSYMTPNYMKSTSSFDARKECSQVSARIPQIGSDSKSPSQKKSNTAKLSLSSGHNKPARSLARTSSLKVVRALTKTTSFKAARPLAKKCSPVVLCENLNVERSTCSSTLKDSKFPAYLALSQGGTESEGTSVMKVCPYTYCSLNGHHHDPLPPLKCFLSARRRMIKTQKSIKMGCLSPRRVRPMGDEMKEVGMWQATFDEKPAIEELDLNGQSITPLLQEENADFFIEIYGKEREDNTDAIDRAKQNEYKHATTDFLIDGIIPSVGGCDETSSQRHDGQDVESFLGEPPCSEIDFEDYIERKSDIVSSGIDMAEFLPEEVQNAEVAEVYPPSLAQENKTREFLSNQQDVEVKLYPRTQPDEPEYEASDMEWEAGQYYVPYLDDEVDNPIQPNYESDLEKGSSLKLVHHTFHYEPIVNSDSSCFKEILADEVLQDAFDEDSMSSESWFGDSTSELASDEYIQVADNESHGLFSPLSNAFEESTTLEERDGDTKSHESWGTGITSVSVGMLIEELSAASEEKKKGVSGADNEISLTNLQLEDDKTECTICIEDAALIDRRETEFLQDDDATAFLGNQEHNNSRDFTEPDQNGTYEKYTEGHNNIEVRQSEAVNDGNRFSDEVFDENLLPKTEDSEIDQNCLKQEFSFTDIEERMDEKEQVDASKSSVGVQTDLGQEVDATKSSVGVQTDLGQEVDAAKSSVGVQTDSWEGSYEAVQNMPIENNDERQLDDIDKDGKPIQSFADDEGLPVETWDSSDEQSQGNYVFENQNHFKKDRDEAEETSNTMDSKDKIHSGITRHSSSENTDQDVHQMEMERTTMSDEEEADSIVEDTSSTQATSALCLPEVHSNQLPEACKNSRGTIRGKRPNEECDESREFNPKEPNYLPVESDPEAETVDLKHQMMDERKNSEEWMLDYALRQAVTKLVPARKKKVALLVEAFETVLPPPKYEFRLRHTSAAFAHPRAIQACS